VFTNPPLGDIIKEEIIKMNKQEAVRLFAERSFNNIPLSLVEKAYENSLFEYIV
jgi:hypothetical protein